MPHHEHIRHRRSLFSVLLTYFLDNFGLAIIYPIFTPLFLKPEHQFVSETTTFFERTVILGLLVGAFPLAQFFGAPVIGQFSDRYGRRKAFFITILGTTIGYIGTAICIMNHSVMGLFLSRALTGLAAGNLTLCLAAVADMSPDNGSRAKNFGQIAAIGGLSFILAIAIGGALSDPAFSIHFNPSFPFWITAGLSLLNFFCVMTLFKETHLTRAKISFHPLRGLHNILLATRDKELRHIYVVNFFFMLAWVCTMQFFPTFLIRSFSYSLNEITLALMVVGLIWSASNLIFNRLLARSFFPGRTYLICLLLLSFFLLSAALVHTPFLFFLLFYPAVCLASLSWTNGLATVSIKAAPPVQGSILGINQSMNSLASMLGPAIGGLLAGMGHELTLYFGALSSLLSFGALWIYKSYRPPPHH